MPTLVIHGDGDATVPFEGKRTHEAIAGRVLTPIPRSVSLGGRA